MRELASVRAILEAKSAGLVELFNARLIATDLHISQLWSVQDLVPRQITEKVDALRCLHEERFGHIEILLQERDRRFDQSLQEHTNHVKSLLRERDLRFVQSDCEVKNSLTGSFLRAKGNRQQERSERH